MSLKRINHGNENHTPGFVEDTGDAMTGDLLINNIKNNGASDIYIISSYGLQLIGYGSVQFYINSTFTGAINKSGIGAAHVLYPVQATTALAPAYIEGGIYYDTTLHKLRIGGAAGWETVTSS